MDRTAGNRRIALMLMIAAANSLGTELTLRFTDMQDRPITSATVGVPFKVALTVDGHERDIESSDIGSLQALQTTGKQTALKHVMAGAQQPRVPWYGHPCGAPYYFIGPARVMTVARCYTAPAITLEVGVKTTEPVQQKSEQAATIIMRLTADKTRAVVGERVRCTLTAYCAHERTRLSVL